MAAPRLKPHHPEEFKKLLEWMTGAKSILEIGSRFGYPLLEYAHVMDGKGRIVSVDLPDAEGWNDDLSREAIDHLRKNVLQLKNEGYDAYLIEGDSRALSIIEMVRSLGPYDVVFIDGGHDERTVRSDWFHYGQMGKRIIFHDIREPKPPENMSLEVWKVWNSIKGWNDLNTRSPVEELIAAGSKMGIGRIDVGETASSKP